YREFLRAPAAVPVEWREYFERLERGGDGAGRPRRRPSFQAPRLFDPRGDRAATAPPASADIARRQDAVDRLVDAYLVAGHLAARIDPLDVPRLPEPELDPAFHGLGEADLDQRFSTHEVGGADVLTLREILDRLRATYCG